MEVMYLRYLIYELRGYHLCERHARFARLITTRMNQSRTTPSHIYTWRALSAFQYLSWHCSHIMFAGRPPPTSNLHPQHLFDSNVHSTIGTAYISLHRTRRIISHHSCSWDVSTFNHTNPCRPSHLLTPVPHLPHPQTTTQNRRLLLHCPHDWLAPLFFHPQARPSPPPHL